MTRRRIVLLATAMLVLAACEAETQLEPTPQALIERAPDVYPGEHQSQGDTVSGEWGTASGISNGVNYEVNDGWTITVCSKGGPDYNIATLTGPTSGFLQTPANVGGTIPDLSHFSVTDITPSEPAPTTTTLVDDTTTTEAAQEPTLPGAAVTTTSTVADGTTPTEIEGTTLPETAGPTSTSSDEGTTTTVVGESQGAEITTTSVGGTNTTGAGQADEGDVGQAEEEPTTTTSGQSTTSGADTQTSAASDTDETLPRTGSSGRVGLVYLFAVGTVLVLLGWGLLRRRSE